MILLGIETSCDETALCLLETRPKAGSTNADFEYRILGNIVHSQIDLHKEFGGVVPILAKREHIKNLPILFAQILKESEIREEQIDAIAVTQGPGLEPALWTGIDFAKNLTTKLSLKTPTPFIPINHMEGHIVSTLLDTSTTHTDFKSLKPLELPALAFLISGGHTEIVHVEAFGTYKILGRTKDDAVGEAFDKVARMLELPYPGGPEISKLAQEARDTNLPSSIILPRPMLHSPDLNMSFSGLKTAVLYTLKELNEKSGTGITQNLRKEISREFENAVTEVLISKAHKALEDHECKTIIVGGGVIANKHIRTAFQTLADEWSIPIYLPAAGLTGDNALMIALAGVLRTRMPSNAPDTTKNPPSIAAKGNLSLEETR